MTNPAKALQTLTDDFVKAVSPYELASRGERHGSWEWVAQKREGELHRSVRLSMTPLSAPDGAGKSNIEVEVSAAAESTDRFHQSLLSSQTVVDSTVASDEFRAELSARLRDAVGLADRFSPGDLDQEYSAFPKLRRA